MNVKPNIFLVMVILAISGVLSGCETVVLKDIPGGGTIPYNDIVYVENDGRCNKGQILRITGGNNALHIPRKTECIDRP